MTATAIPSVLCVHAHPDDEALWTGGVLARAADAGARTAVVTCTWAEGTRRVDELERSLNVLGAGKPRLLGYADARVPESAPGQRFCDAPLDEAVGRLVGHIRDFRPDVVITYDGYGTYGHEDHVQAHRVTLAAVEAAGYDQLYPTEGPPWRASTVYLATIPRSIVAAHWRHLPWAAGDVPLPGVPDDRVTDTVDVSPWVDRKWTALREHESELTRGATMTRLAKLPAPVRDRLLATEWYSRRDLGAGMP